jgi:hypothetical protein
MHGAGGGTGVGPGGSGAGAGGVPGGGAGACEMVIVSPAMLTVPRRASPAFAATLNRIVPLPLPLDPATTAIHPTLLATVHEHAGELAPTLTVIVPPAAAMGPSGAASVKRHGAGSCATSTDVSFTVTVPWRDEGSPFAATRYDTVPSP